MANWLDIILLIVQLIQVVFLGTIAYFLWRYLSALGLIHVRSEPSMITKEVFTGEEPEGQKTASVDWMEL